ncbi:MAG TPA: hypothetical protein DDZ80_02305 [Cyanobacteria bacterium UBA8803]|nr:hypothetical protein [Cyanobacteria bacterium UBA9273]HBL57416.1 hypothetical protein [Cyanobacteria bacterium UBA8803]
MHPIKYLFHLIGTAAVIGIGFNSTSAHALTLSLAGNVIANNIQDNTTEDLDPLANIIDFRFTNQALTDSSGDTATVSGLVRARWGSGSLSTEIGASLGGVLLTLRELELTASASNEGLFNFTSNLITFSHNFNYQFVGRTGTPPSQLTAYQRLSGEFNSNSTSVIVNSNNSVTFDGFVNNSLIASLSSGQTAALTISTINIPTASKTFSNANRVLDNPLLEGKIAPLTLAAGQTLKLPNSACLLVADQDPDEPLLTDADVEKSCSQSVPEPSSALNLLALGILGTSYSCLKRKQK